MWNKTLQDMWLMDRNMNSTSCCIFTTLSLIISLYEQVSP